MSNPESQDPRNRIIFIKELRRDVMEARCFEELAIGNICGVQTAQDRFGAEAIQRINAMIWTIPHVVANTDDEAGTADGPEAGDEDEDDDDDDDEDDDSDGGFPAWLDTAGLDVDQLNSVFLGDNGGPSEPSFFPGVARVRLNLTALSQRYNLYFTAYQDEIYVYRPRKAPQILSLLPDLVLQPRPSREARAVGGYIDRRNPHQVNHIITGDLGDLEIVLMCFDDGDVVAYYTHKVAHYVEWLENARLQDQVIEITAAKKGEEWWDSCARPNKPKWFFRENVGKTAWGLAIHKKSRLIAVSSNLVEVTVFAFALAPSPASSPDARGMKASWPAGTDVPDADKGYSPVEQMERYLKSRSRNWRIVMPLGPEASNIPSVSFLDDGLGNANMVVAADIYGSVWLVDMWTLGSEPVRIQQTSSSDAVRIMGWGVMVLTGDSFKPTETFSDTTGLWSMTDLAQSATIPEGNERIILADVTRSLASVKSNASQPASALNNLENTFKAYPTGSPTATPVPFDDTSDGDNHHAWLQIIRLSSNLAKHLMDCGVERHGEEVQGFSLGMAIVPFTGETFPEFSTKALLQFAAGAASRQDRNKSCLLSQKRFPHSLVRDVRILHTNATDIKLLPLENTEVGAICRSILVQHNHHRRQTPWDLTDGIGLRISMVLHVRELHLVVLGSLCGRVALLTLTQPTLNVVGGPLPVRKAFRVEAILPRLAEEEKRLRPFVALHGVAVSPVCEYEREGLLLTQPGATPRRWRIILHYSNHTILEYIVGREPTTDVLDVQMDGEL